MPKLTLMFDGRQVQECAVGAHPVSIGRLPDNMIVIDNPAVSGRHARVIRDGAHFVVEDLQSTNGTFVNEKPIARHTLADHDVVLVGKHALVFSMVGGEHAAPAEAAPLPPDLVVPRTTSPLAPSSLGVVRVVAGPAEQQEYTLTGITTIIGKTASAQIKLKGWFKPDAAAALARKDDGYTVSSMGATTRVNGSVITGRHDLRDGDVIEVSGLTLEFHLKPSGF